MHKIRTFFSNYGVAAGLWAGTPSGTLLAILLLWKLKVSISKLASNVPPDSACISISTLTTREKMIHDSGGVKTVTGKVADTVFKMGGRTIKRQQRILQQGRCLFV
jgi:hypothetical protein